MDALTDVMRGVLNESEQKKQIELREYYKPLRETLRGTTLEVRRDSAEFAELDERLRRRQKRAAVGATCARRCLAG